MEIAVTNIEGKKTRLHPVLFMLVGAIILIHVFMGYIVMSIERVEEQDIKAVAMSIQYIYFKFYFLNNVLVFKM